MPQSLANLLTHVIFSTKGRRPTITPELMPRLHAFLGGVVRTEGGEALGVGGTEDHVHLLTRTPPRIAVADLVRVVKSVSRAGCTRRLPCRRLHGRRGTGRSR